MKTIAPLLICIVLFSCSKNNDNPNPNTPVVHPDTLTTGWTSVTINGKPSLNDVYFANNLVGYIVGDSGGISKSTDGGNTWTPVFNSNEGRNLFVTQDGKVFMLNRTPYVYFSTNNGANFDSVSVGATGILLGDIFFTDNNNGFIIGSSLWQTTDAGAHWNVVTPGLPTGSASPIRSSLFFLDNSTGWVINETNGYHTNGSVNDWQVGIINTSSSASFTSVYATDANTIYFTKSSGIIYKSTDGGANINLLSQLDQYGSWADIHFINNSTGYFSCGKKIYKTTDAGVSWQTVVTMGDDEIIEIHFTDADHGWACGVNGKVLIYHP